MLDELEMAVRQFVVEQAAGPSETIHLDTTLLGDLGVTGDDAYDFFIAFAERFNVDMSSLDLSLHFDAEGGTVCDLMKCIAAWIRDPAATPETRSGHIPIRVRDLIDAARCGKWSMPG